MATHSSILAWKIARTGARVGLYSPWGQKESDTAEATEHETHQISAVCCKSVISQKSYFRICYSMTITEAEKVMTE